MVIASVLCLADLENLLGEIVVMLRTWGTRTDAGNKHCCAVYPKHYAFGREVARGDCHGTVFLAGLRGRQATSVYQFSLADVSRSGVQNELNPLQHVTHT